MNGVGQPERATQNRVVALFRDELSYRYLGDRTDCDGNSNIEEALLTAWLAQNNHTPAMKLFMDGFYRWAIPACAVATPACHLPTDCRSTAGRRCRRSA